MSKKIRAVLPSYGYEIAMGIIRNNKLEEREKSISEQLKNTTDVEIRKSLDADMPSLILARITRKAVEENLSEEEVVSLLVEKLRVEEKKAEKINIELQKKLIFFTEAIEVEDENKKTKEGENEIKNQEKTQEQEKKEKLKKKIIKKEINSDPYREIIE